VLSLFDDLEVEIVQLLSSPRHRYDGRPSDGPVSSSDHELRETLELRAGLGIVGDRYFNQSAHLTSSVTFQAAESLEHVARELGVTVPTLTQTRRNVLLRGVNIDGLARTPFSLDAGDGPIRFTPGRPANPCAWMDVAIAPGAHRAFRRRGGLRTGPLDDGILRLGPAILRITCG